MGTRKQKKKLNLPQLTFGSFNIQGGINSKCKLYEFNRLISDFDVCCLQETWLQNQESVNVPGYEQFRSECKKGKKANRNSGGVLVPYRSKFLNDITRIPSSDKHFVWFKLDSNFLDLQEEIFVCDTYISPSNSVYFKDQEIDIFDQLHSDIVKYSATGQIIIMGDLNSRLGSSQETFSYIDDNPDEQGFINNIDYIPVQFFSGY